MLGAAVACFRSAPDPMACAPVSGELARSASLAPLVGRFVLTLAATSGPKSGQRVDGYLTLRAAPHDSTASPVFVGTTDLAVEMAGAARLGDLLSENPRAPGVAVYQAPGQGATTSVMARLGSAANGASASQPIEGAFTALRIVRVTADAFQGSWRSSDGGGGDARGYFCAQRLKG